MGKKGEVINALLNEYREKFVKLNEEEKLLISEETNLSKPVFISEFLLKLNNKIISFVFINTIKQQKDDFEIYGPFKNTEFLYKIVEVLKSYKYAMPIEDRYHDTQPYSIIISNAINIGCSNIKDSLFSKKASKNKEFLKRFNRVYNCGDIGSIHLEINEYSKKEDQIINFLGKQTKNVRNANKILDGRKKEIQKIISKLKQDSDKNKKEVPDMLEMAQKKAYATYLYPDIFKVDEDSPEKILFKEGDDNEKNPVFISVKKEINEQLIRLGITKNGLLFVEINERPKIRKVLILLYKKGFNYDECNFLLSRLITYKKKGWDIKGFLNGLEDNKKAKIILAIKEIEPIIDEIISKPGKYYRKQALYLFNTFVSLINLEGINLMNIRKLDIYETEVDSKRIEPIFFLDPEKLYYKLDLLMQKDKIDKNDYYNKKELLKKLKNSISIYEDPGLVKLLYFYSAAFSEFNMSAYEESFIMSWIIIEQYFYDLFKKNFNKIQNTLPNRRINKTKLKDFQDPQQVLEKISSFGFIFKLLVDSILNSEMAKLIKNLYKIRKELVHTSSNINPKDARRSLIVFETILKHKLKNKGIKIKSKFNKKVTLEI